MNDELKKHMLSMYYHILEEGIDLNENPVLFKWSYDEEPYVQFQLLIKEHDEVVDNGSDTTIH